MYERSERFRKYAAQLTYGRNLTCVRFRFKALYNSEIWFSLPHDLPDIDFGGVQRESETAAAAHGRVHKGMRLQPLDNPNKMIARDSVGLTDFLGRNRAIRVFT
jgi:hypothetical protein